VEWQTAIAIGALGVALFSAFSKLMDKSLSIREHEEYRRGVEDQIKMILIRQELRLTRNEHLDWITQARRDVDRIEELLKELAATRPTTGELEARIEAVRARIDTLEHRKT
jgi:hypothetical protein